MAAETPTLNLLYIDTHNSSTLGIADISQYPTGFTVQSPTVEITPPSFNKETIPFVANSLQIYNSHTLGITSGDCTPTALPDGIYTIKYTVFPAYRNYVTKSFLRIEQLLEKFDKIYVKLDIMQCDLATRNVERKQLNLIWEYINGAIASANNCAEKQAMELYNRADAALDKFSKNCACN